MAGALYRKYRSKNFEEVIGQEHITKTLVNSIDNKSFAHAYLLTGPRGVGKTSVARLFAFSINGLDYDETGSYSDIIEIDAASNRRIDEIRDLREKVNIAPSSLKYKVYIIDEVHMLTKEAFNALLKTLEEPPEHAIFVLATTDFHKVPDTIVSRCVRFTFSSISAERIKEHLKNIARKESIDIEDGAIGLLAESSEGSFRDALSLLDQFRSSKEKVTQDYVAQVLGIGGHGDIKSLAKAIEQANPKHVIESLEKLRSKGIADSQIIKQTIQYYQGCLMGKEKTSLNQEEIIKVTHNLLKASNYTDTSLALDVYLLSSLASSTSLRQSNREEDSFTPDKTKEVQQSPKKSSKIPEESAIRSIEPDPETDKTVENTSSDRTESLDLWTSVLIKLKNSNSTLYAIARMAQVEQTEKNLELHFEFPFHFKQMNLEKNRILLNDLVKTIDESIEKISIHSKEKVEKKSSASESGVNSKQSIANISNIFGSVEVLES